MTEPRARGRLSRGGACAALLLAALSGCQALPWGLSRCPAPLRPVTALGPDTALRATVRLVQGDRSAHLDLSIEKRDDELVLVARNELGAIAFAVVQRGEVAEIVRSLPRALLPLPPEVLLSDVQQVFFGDGAARSGLRTERCGYTAHFALREAP